MAETENFLKSATKQVANSNYKKGNISGKYMLINKNTKRLNILSKGDNSLQGFVDKDIKPLLDRINSHKEFETTSSCSGRIVLISRKGKKGVARWLYKTHNKADPKKIWEALQKAKGRAWLMQEPLIIHIRCSNFVACRKLLGICNKAGLKHSGMFSAKNFMVEIRGTERIETIVDKKLTTKGYFYMLLKEANKSLDKAKEKIKRLEREF